MTMPWNRKRRRRKLTQGDRQTYSIKTKQWPTENQHSHLYIPWISNFVLVIQWKSNTTPFHPPPCFLILRLLLLLSIIVMFHFVDKTMNNFLSHSRWIILHNSRLNHRVTDKSSLSSGITAAVTSLVGASLFPNYHTTEKQKRSSSA